MTELQSRGTYTFWYYVPSLGAAVIFLLLFIVLTGLHCWKLFTTRTWFCISFTLGGVFEIIGYIGRAAAHSNTTAMGPYIVSNMFILLGPTLFAASIYMTLGRIIRSVKGEHLSVIRISRLTKTFVWGDVLSFVVQGNSSGLSVLGYPLYAKLCVIVGLVIQLISFAIFWLTAVVFGKRIARSPTTESCNRDLPWQQSLHMLYAVSSLVLVRSIFRIIEYVMGNDGYPLQHEWTMYIFDSVPMAIVMLIFYIWYPNRLQRSAGQSMSISREFPSPFVLKERDRRTSKVSAEP
ncbi:putative RTA1 domain protein [Aspergillus sclerotiicarbonarius CBS 121057]|uniref:Putative RTA1 domain protein n=1 Tax=Aspergillus sclerotiicarbonarius (strain CBS 121057 / IBT 28362) TaxID=1448318 RepID=A0A319ETC7_ASPSB|nr:putative RTA1 domain protein [Aspergillus sclerotiicarbonarius CBS 121057]